MRYLLSKVLAALASRTWEHCVGFKIKKVLKYLPPEKQMPTTGGRIASQPADFRSLPGVGVISAGAVTASLPSIGCTPTDIRAADNALTPDCKSRGLTVVRLARTKVETRP